MSNINATAEVFLIAFKALSTEEQTKTLQRLLTDEEIEDLLDGMVIDSRKDEPSSDFKKLIDKAS